MSITSHATCESSLAFGIEARKIGPETKVVQSVLKRPEGAMQSFSEGKFGWGGRIRTFTVLINSEVSYQLDHAPAEL